MATEPTGEGRDEQESPTVMDRLRQEFAAVALAPIVLSVAAIVTIAVVWAIVYWTYGAILSSKDSHIAFLERRVADYRSAVAGASPDEARGRIEALENEVKALQIRLQPRRLTAAQRQAIADRSRGPAGAPPSAVTVVFEQDCSDCAAFAADIVAALQASGTWEVTTAGTQALSERPRTGLAIRVGEPTRPPSEAIMLQRALRSAKLSFLMLSGATGTNAELLVSERIPQ